MHRLSFYRSQYFGITVVLCGQYQKKPVHYTPAFKNILALNASAGHFTPSRNPA